MDLDEFLFRTKLTHKDFAKLSGLSYSLISKLARSQVVPSPQTALKIEKVTNGKVEAWPLILKCLEYQENIKLEKKGE